MSGGRPSGDPPLPGWVRLLSRETSGGALIPAIDGLRFVAIALVVLYHVVGYTLAKRHGVAWHEQVPTDLGADPLVRLGFVGFFGVQLFFAISGFILAVPFARARLFPETPAPKLGAYFLRRLYRLEPPYVLNLFLLGGLLVALRGADPLDTAKHLGPSVLYLHNVVFGEPSTINGAAWSLEVEVQFYILAPWLCAVFAVRDKVPRRAILGALIVGGAAAQGLLGAPLWSGLSLAHQIPYFLVGLLLADVHLSDAPPRSGRWDLVGLAGWVGLLAVLLGLVRPDHTTHGWIVPLLTCPAIFLAYGGALWGTTTNRLFSSPWLYVPGGMCYTTYLWHFLVVSIAGGVLLRFVPAGWSVGAAIVALLVPLSVLLAFVSSALFVTIEKPCMKKDWPTRLRAALKGR